MIVLLALAKLSGAQEAAPFKVHAKAISRITNQTLSTISGKLAEGIISGKLSLYSDESCTLKMPAQDQKAFLQKKITHSFEKQVEGKTVKKDTLLTFRFGPDWIGQYKMGTAGNLGVYINFPEALKTPSQWFCYLKASEYQKMFTDPEMEFLTGISVNGGVPCSKVGKYFWESIEKNRSAWLNDEIQKYKNQGLTDSLSALEYQETYKIMSVETVVPDPSHREFDYQQSVFLPLIADSLKGFSFRCALRKDPTGGPSLTLSPVSVSPLWDPSGTAADPFMLETTFWISASDFYKKLNASDRNKLNLLTLLFIQERMDTDCTF